MPLKRKLSFTNSYYFLNSIRLTLAVMIPFLLAIFQILPAGFHIGLGAIAMGLLDTQSILRKRLKSTGINAVVFFIGASLIGLLLPYPNLLGLLLIPIVFIITLLALGEGEGSSVSLGMLLIITFSQDEAKLPSEAIIVGLYYAMGAIWYGLLITVLYLLNPNKHLNVLFGELLKTFSSEVKEHFVIKRSSRQKPAVEQLKVFEKEDSLINKLQEVRQSVLQRKSYAQRFTKDGRKYILLLQAVADIHESILNQEEIAINPNSILYRKGFIKIYEEHLELIQKDLKNLAQSFFNQLRPCELGSDIKSMRTLEESIEKEVFNAPNNFDLEEVLILKKSIRSLLVIAQNIRKSLEAIEGKPKRIQQFKPTKNLDSFVDESSFSFQKIWNKISFESALFRYCIRFTIGYVASYWLCNYFNIQQGYWAMLTIVVLVKPDYAVTMSRIFNRVIGTVTGGLVGFLILQYVHNDSLLTIFTIIFAANTFYFIKKKYVVGVFFLTVYILMLYGILTESGTQITIDRIVNTFIGVFVTMIVNVGFFPEWQANTIFNQYQKMLKATADYVNSLSVLITTNKGSEYRLARKQMQIRTGNYINSFKLMVQEPSSKQLSPTNYYTALIYVKQIQASIGFLEKQHQVLPLEKDFAPFQAFLNEVEDSLRQVSAMKENIAAPTLDIAPSPLQGAENEQSQQAIIKQHILQSECTKLELAFKSLLKNHSKLQTSL